MKKKTFKVVKNRVLVKKVEKKKGKIFLRKKNLEKKYFGNISFLVFTGGNYSANSGNLENNFRQKFLHFSQIIGSYFFRAFWVLKMQFDRFWPIFGML